MHLWTEYEGITLNGYPLGRLHRSEGRSAFFLTTTPAGPAMLRLTESHFDDAELVGRWQHIAAIQHPHLQTIEHFGRATYDHVSLACCLLQLDDSSLSDVLADRALSTDEAKEVAEAVAGALAALHAAGLVHEHVDATNVFAMGETIKLRSDCARECAGDFEADTPGAREALRQRDVRDLGLLLLRCLGLPQATTAKPLPDPFSRIIPGTLNGTLSAAGILAVLNPPAAIVAPPTSTVPEKPVDAAMQQPLANPAPAASPRIAAKPISNDPFDVRLGSLRNEPRQDAGLPAVGGGILRRLSPRVTSSTVWIATGAAAAIIVIVLWNTTGRTKDRAADAHAAIAAESTPSRPAPAPVSIRGGVRHAKPSAITGLQPAQPSLLNSGVQAGWHVIAYTYNYEQQAQAKAEHLNRDYKALQPQVFTPTGHAPYFVALGGPSDSVSAFSLRDRARRVGLPRDTYARNF